MIMKNLIIISSVLALFFLASCEKVIQLDLNEGEKQFVVDAMVSNVPAYNYVKITKSAYFYDNNDFAPVEGAIVTITDQNGVVIPLIETSAGYYENPLLVGQAYQNYALKIEAEGQVIEANTFVPGVSAIDSIVTLKAQGGFFGDGYTAFAYWNDKGNEKNYYRLRTRRNDSLQDPIYITEDNLFNGIPTGTPLFSTEYDSADVAIVELMEIDERTYKYWYSLDQISNPQNQPAAPGNPLTNLSNNALGYFGGYNIDIDTVVVE
jgi:hypothetical protein